MILFLIGCFVLDRLPDGIRPKEPASNDTAIIIRPEFEPEPTTNRTTFCSVSGAVENGYVKGHFCLSPTTAPAAHRAQNEHFVWVVTP